MNIYKSPTPNTTDHISLKEYVGVCWEIICEYLIWFPILVPLVWIPIVILIIKYEPKNILRAFMREMEELRNYKTVERLDIVQNTVINTVMFIGITCLSGVYWNFIFIGLWNWISVIITRGIV